MKIPCLTLSLTVVGPFGHTPLEMQKYSKSAEGKVLLKLSIPQALSCASFETTILPNLGLMRQ
jgi:hypothetical protein